MEKVNSKKSRKVVGIILSILIVTILAYIGTVIITSRTVTKISKDTSSLNFAGIIGVGESPHEELKDLNSYDFDADNAEYDHALRKTTITVPESILEQSDKFDVYGLAKMNMKLIKIHGNLTPVNGKLVFVSTLPVTSWVHYVIAFEPPPSTDNAGNNQGSTGDGNNQGSTGGGNNQGSAGGGNGQGSTGAGNNQGSTRTGDFWSDAGSWFGDAQNENKEAGLPAEAQNIIKIFADMINVIGTSIIALVTIFLGVKYMYGSVDAKVSVKESLPDLLVACVFFFGWSSIRTLLMPNDVLVFMGAPGESYQSLVARIFGIGMYIANFLVVAAVIYVGVRYIFSGAEGRADLKVKSPQFILGIVMAFAASTFLTFVSSVVNQIFAG